VRDRWLAVDVETAADRDSICAVGIVESVGGDLRPVGRWLLRPPRGVWSGFNISIHGIQPGDVAGKPTLAQWWPEFLAILGDDPVVAHHAAFDMNAFRYTLEACEVDVAPIRFACSRIVARDAWPGLWSYSLPIVVQLLGLPAFAHHDPLDDALASARIVQRALSKHGASSLDALVTLRRLRWGWADESLYEPFIDCKRTWGRIVPPEPVPGVIFDEGHPLFGRLVAFTGTLDSMTRRDAAQLVVDIGGHFGNGVTKKTNYLVCGYQDFRFLAEGASISSKKQKAQALISAGADLELVPEDEFIRLVHSGAPSGSRPSATQS
jgi:DNA polymerase-3 subunit epsilon